jgi:hypothetical protein
VKPRPYESEEIMDHTAMPAAGAAFYWCIPDPNRDEIAAMSPPEAIPHDARRAERSASPAALALLMVLGYVAVVFGSGTMQQSEDPLVAGTGEAIQQATLIEPAIQWALSHGLTPLADLLQYLANGIDPHTVLTVLSSL